jgi:SNF2 family DNA or RNA helicase
MTGEKRASMATNKYGERVVRIEFPYDLDTIFQVRQLPGRAYHAEERVWSAPVHLETLQQLIAWGFTLDDRLKEFIRRVTKREQELGQSNIEGLRKTLFPFQGEGVAFIERHEGRALVADEMGLGKTVQALAWLQLKQDVRPAVVVCPAAVKLNWEREANVWMTNPGVVVLQGTKAKRVRGRIVIVNYDILNSWVDELRRIQPQAVVLDEAHYVKSNKTQRTKAVKQLVKGCPHVIALSGTPIVNRPVEIYNAIRMIDPALFPNYMWYCRRYCAARHTGFGWNFSGASNTDELHETLTRTVMIRRLKRDVLKELPDKIRAFVPIELANTDTYMEAERDFIQYVKKVKGKEAAQRASNAEAFGRIETLKQLAVKGKLRQAMEWIETFLESDEKLVVFCTHRFVVDKLMDKFRDVAVRVDGSVTGKERQTYVDMFQMNKRVRLFVGNIQAAGVGITLTAASNVAFLELPWAPGAVTQAEDRCHRIGQKDTVNIHYLLATGTIEERLAHLIDSKRRVLDAVLDGRETDEESLLSELMKQYTEEDGKH